MARRYHYMNGFQRLAALCGTLIAVACAATAPKPTPPAQPAVIIPSLPAPGWDAFYLATHGDYKYLSR